MSHFDGVIRSRVERRRAAGHDLAGCENLDLEAVVGRIGDIAREELGGPEQVSSDFGNADAMRQFNSGAVCASAGRLVSRRRVRCRRL
jgi:hypothetical protein